MIKALNADERAHLVKYGVPEDVVDQIDFLIDELNGALVADGWASPAGQTMFLAQRLLAYAVRLAEIGMAEVA